MSEKNNFKELEKEQIELYASKEDRVKNSLDANMGGIRFFSDIIELYLSKMLGYFVKMSGGSEPNEKDRVKK